MELTRINKKWVRINFSDDFSWDKVNAVKKIPGREYKPDTENWHVPLNTRENATHFLRFCNQFGVDQLPNQIEKMIKELREEFRKEEEREQANRTLATGATSNLDRVYGTAKGMQLREYQRAAVEYIEKNKRAIIGDEQGLGKAQPLDAKLLTPNGWQKMGEIEVDDEVIGRDGSPTKVTGVYPQGKKEIYEVTFSHGASTRACGEHLWHVQTNNGKRRGYHKVKTTEELIDDLRYGGKNNQSKWFAPLIEEPVRFEEDEEYKIDPYALGLLIGDGSLREEHISFSSGDEDLIENLEIALPQKANLTHISEYDYSISYGQKTEENIVQTALRKNDLLKNSEHKFIPDKFKYGTPETRIAVLQGLFDTDGSVQGSGVVFSSASHQLSKDVQEVVRSLGGTASLHTCEATYTYDGEKKQGQERHRVYAKLPLDMEPFQLERKKEKLENPQGAPCRTIKSIEKVGKKEAQCISVEAEDSLYVTDDYVVTHNTVEAIGAVQHLDAYPVLCVVPAAVRSHWEKEWKTWVSRRAVKTIKSGKHTDFRGSINIVTYSLVYKFIDKFKKKDFQAIIADESHKLKNSSTKRASAVKEIARANGGIPYRMLLTGTPVINQPSEIINQLKILGVFKDVFGGWMQFTDRYCLPPDAPVLMSNLKEKEISKVEEGDKVIGWREQEGNKNRKMTEETVIGNYRREAELIEATLENGQTIRCTPDHNWLSGRGRFGVSNRSQKWTNVPSKTKFSSKLSFLFRTNNEANTETKDYKKGYLIGAYRGDGWLSKKTIETEKIWRDKPNTSYNKYTSGIATEDEKIIDRCEEYLQEFEVPYGRRERKDGLHEINNNSEEAFNFFTSDQNKSGDWYSGFLAGLYDTDGSGNFICQYKKHNSSTRKITEEAFQALEFEDYEKRSNGIRIGNGRNSLIRFYQKTDPALRRKIKSYVLGSGGRFFSDDPEVVDVKEIGKQKVHSIETTSGNYVAYGLASKNCDRKDSQFGQWDISGASNLDELYDRLTGNCYVRRNKDQEDILEELPAKQRSVVELEIDNRSKYNDVEENLADHLREKYKEDDDFAEQIDHLSEPLKEAHKERHAEAKVRRAMNAEHLVKINELRQVTSEGKYKEAKKWIRNFRETGEPLLLFAHYKETTQKLADEFDCPKITGDVGSDRRGEIVEEFQNGDHDLLVLNIEAGGVGITLTEASNVAFVEIPWTWAETVQAEDRTHRIGQEEAVNIYFLLAEDTIDEWMWELVSKKKMITDVVNKGISSEEVEQKSIEGGIAEKVMEKYDI